MSELFPELDKAFLKRALRNGVCLDGKDEAIHDSLQHLQDLAIVIAQEHRFVRCAYQEDYDFPDLLDVLDCEGIIEVTTADIYYCPDCGRPINNDTQKTMFVEYEINLNPVGIERYLERALNALSIVERVEKLDQATLRVQLKDGKVLKAVIPNYANVRHHSAGLFFAEPIMYIIESPIYQPSTTVIEARQYLQLVDLLSEPSKTIADRLQTAAIPVAGRRNLLELETKFGEMLTRHKQRAWQFFEQDFIPALVRHITENPTLAQQYLEKLRRLSATIFCYYHVPIGGSGLPDMIPINKYELMSQFFEGNATGECKCYQGSTTLTYEEVIKTNGHLDMNFAGAGMAVMYVSTDNVASTAWDTMQKLKRPDGRWKIIIIPKYLLLELISELEAEHLLRM